ncbi:MAG: hypothetical protein SFW63_06290 [Alphaproteobacteria bacterium]|nr:hypothetical protein [Alphaproteobacteria bacterium]
MAESRKPKRFVYGMNVSRSDDNSIKMLDGAFVVSAKVASQPKEDGSVGINIECGFKCPDSRESFKKEVPEFLQNHGEQAIECFEAINKKFLESVKNAADVAEQYHNIKLNLGKKAGSKDKRIDSMRALAKQLIRNLIASYENQNEYNFRTMRGIEELKDFAQSMPTVSIGSLLAESAAIIKKNNALYPYQPDSVEKDLADYKEIIESNFQHILKFLLNKRDRNHAIMTTEKAEEQWNNNTAHMLAAKDALFDVVATFYDQWFGLMKLMRSPAREAAFINKQEAEAARDVVIKAIDSAAEKYAQFKLEAGYLPESMEGLAENSINSRDTFDDIEDTLEHMREMANKIYANPLEFREKTLGNVESKSAKKRGGRRGRGE